MGRGLTGDCGSGECSITLTAFAFTSLLKLVSFIWRITLSYSARSVSACRANSCQPMAVRFSATATPCWSCNALFRLASVPLLCSIALRSIAGCASTASRSLAFASASEALAEIILGCLSLYLSA